MHSDGLEFLAYIWRRRKLIAMAGGAALLVTGAVSLLLPVRYTATASVLIEPPGGNDPRAATAVSPVYLESLKTYEHLASSDTLFSRALDDLHLRERFPRTSVESLKRRILSVDKPTNTSIIEIGATLDDPRLAQALAQYMAERTVQLNASLDKESNQDIALEPQRTYDAAEARLAAAKKNADRFARTSNLEDTAKQVAAASDLKAEVQAGMVRARAELADYLARREAPQPANIDEGQPGWTQLEIAGTRARLQDLQNQDRQLQQLLSEKELLLQNLTQTRDSLDDELKSARVSEETANAKLGDVRSSAAFRGVRLKVLDPGIVPQRPSSPNIPVNMVVAFVFSIIGCIAFLAFRVAAERYRRSAADPVNSLR